MNMLMLVEVVSRLSPPLQAFVCSAGGFGYHTFEEAVKRNDVPACVIIPCNQGRGLPCPMYAPVRVQMKPAGKHRVIPTRAQVILSRKAILQRGESEDRWMGYRNVRVEGCGSSSMPAIASSMVNTLEVSGFENVSNIGSRCMSFMKNLKVLDVSAFTNVTHIGDFFLSGCEALCEIDLAPFNRVISIGSSFLSQNQKLTIVDLSSMVALKTVGDSLCDGDLSLKSLKLPRIARLKVGKKFAYYCQSLTDVDLSVVGRISCSDSMITSCVALQSISLEPFKDMTTIPSSFLSDSGPSILDLGPLCNVTRAQDYAFLSMKNLGVLDLTPLSNITTIDSCFFAACSLLTSIDLSPLSNVTSVGYGFFKQCTGLLAVDLSPMDKVAVFGDALLVCCTAMQSVVLPKWNSTTVPARFLGYCKNLQSIDLTPLTGVTKVKDYFLTGCTSLGDIDLGPLSNVTNVGCEFIRDSRCSPYRIKKPSSQKKN